MSTALNYFNEALKSYDVGTIASHIGLHKNTIERWKDMGKVPQQYILDLSRLLGKSVKLGGVKDKDQYFTKPEIAEWCFNKFKKTAKKLELNLNEYDFIEPSMGNGCFYDILPEGRRTGIDIDPKRLDTIKADYLKWQPENKSKKYIVIGNPPFGLRGHLALQFINHSQPFADVVAFILPQLFEIDGKGVPAKRVKGYKLVLSEKLDSRSFEYPDGSPIQIHTVFQIWTKVNQERIKIPEPETCNSYIKIYSLSDGGTPASTRNKKMLYKCDVYLPSTTFQRMKTFNNFEDLPHRRGYGIVIHKEKRKIKKIFNNHNWNETAFSSTNSALNLRMSLIKDVIIKSGFKD